MIEKLVFTAEPTEAMKVTMDLQMPDDLKLKFSLSGECDKKTLKRLIRIIKSSAKDAKPTANKN